MRITIRLTDRREIEAELTEEEYEELERELTRGKIKFLSFENQLLKTSAIESIEKVFAPIPERRRLPEPRLEKAGLAEAIERTFNLLKSKGLFREYDNYQDWQRARGE